MCWNKGGLCWKMAKLFYFCHLNKLVRPETFGPYYVFRTSLIIGVHSPKRTKFITYWQNTLSIRLPSTAAFFRYLLYIMFTVVFHRCVTWSFRSGELQTGSVEKRVLGRNCGRVILSGGCWKHFMKFSLISLHTSHNIKTVVVTIHYVENLKGWIRSKWENNIKKDIKNNVWLPESSR